MWKKTIVSITWLFLSVIYSFAHAEIAPSSQLFGITLDDSWEGSISQTQIIKAIKAMPVRPTVRIVMNYANSSSHYKKLFKAVHEVANILACPCDSAYMNNYTTVESYRNRFVDSYTILGPYVNLWEIGNEINGEGWLGDNPKLIADKMYAAFRYIYSKGKKTVLTSYMFKPGDQSISMNDWLIKYVPFDMKAKLDYLLVSYYEDDNSGYQPNWYSIFYNLKEIFPNSKLGIGECGKTIENSTVQSKTKLIEHYYSMPVYVDCYIGGYFWWNWVQDCVPHEDSTLWRAINKGMKVQLEINK